MINEWAAMSSGRPRSVRPVVYDFFYLLFYASELNLSNPSYTLFLRLLVNFLNEISLHGQLEFVAFTDYVKYLPLVAKIHQQMQGRLV